MPSTWASPISNSCRSASIPLDISWGYQPIGLFAPTAPFRRSRRLSRVSSIARITARLGVMLDWVPAHFPIDAHGLANFDGTALYEHADPRQGFHPDWNTAIYNFGRREVVATSSSPTRSTGSSATTSTACASMPSPRCSTSIIRAQPGEWIPNDDGGQREPRGRRFLRRVNELTYALHPGSHDDRGGIDRLAGRVARRPMSAGWASASSGTWAGCTTPSITCRRSRCIGSGTTTR